MRAEERRSDVESELASDDPMDLDDMVFSDEEESQEVVVTSVVRHDPTVTSASEEQEATRRAEVPALRKHAASVDAIGERAAKRTRSPRPQQRRWFHPCLLWTWWNKASGPRSGLAPIHHRGR